MNTKQRTWLWPNRTIGKRESGELREEHNALVNLNGELLAALEGIFPLGKNGPADSVWWPALRRAGLSLEAEALSDLGNIARAAIAKAKGN